MSREVFGFVSKCLPSKQPEVLRAFGFIPGRHSKFASQTANLKFPSGSSSRNQNHFVIERDAQLKSSSEAWTFALPRLIHLSAPRPVELDHYSNWTWKLPTRIELKPDWICISRSKNLARGP